LHGWKVNARTQRSLGSFANVALDLYAEGDVLCNITAPLRERDAGLDVHHDLAPHGQRTASIAQPVIELIEQGSVEFGKLQPTNA
jgi:hypothetical protein